jgi:hypothetical protein
MPIRDLLSAVNAPSLCYSRPLTRPFVGGRIECPISAKPNLAAKPHTSRSMRRHKPRLAIFIDCLPVSDSSKASKSQFPNLRLLRHVLSPNLALES